MRSSSPFPLQLFGNIYDLQTVKPKPEYVAAVQRSIDALRECGVPVSEQHTGVFPVCFTPILASSAAWRLYPCGPFLKSASLERR